MSHNYAEWMPDLPTARPAGAHVDSQAYFNFTRALDAEVRHINSRLAALEKRMAANERQQGMPAE